MSYFASKYVRIVTGFKVNDTTAGFVCYRRKVLETIALDAIRFKGYACLLYTSGTAQTRCGIELATLLLEEAVIIRSKHRRTQAQDTDCLLYTSEEWLN